MISFKEKEGRFNFRAGGIILNKDKTKILVQEAGLENDFYVLPGGRIEWHESSIDALKRELNEELGMVNVSAKERAFIENFYEFDGYRNHEVYFCFLLDENKDNLYLEEKEAFFGRENEKYLYKWVNIKDINKINLLPKVLINIVSNYDKSFEYVIQNDFKE